MSALLLSHAMYRRHPLTSAFITFWVLVPLLGYAEQFTGKVVGISDGGTISVLRAGKAVKVRLHGIDTPERAQAFGTQARKFTGDVAFQQTVTVDVRATDRYGRLVEEERLPDGRRLNQELVRAGMAWWYRQHAPNESLSHGPSPRAHKPFLCDSSRVVFRKAEVRADRLQRLPRRV